MSQRRRYISVTGTAKLIRAALKAGFPEQKFSVRSNSYAGGASIDVGWTDGPFVAPVQTTIQRFEGASFDGMIDLKSYHDSILVGPDGEPEVVHFGADFVFANRRLSKEYGADLLVAAKEYLARNADWKPGWPVWTPFGTVGHAWRAEDLIVFLSNYLTPEQAAQPVEV